ncbi:MAG: sigma-70 family RNA polymerase sigma factor [Planctomycetota bacterium]
MASRPDATRLVTDLSGGNERAADELLRLVYDELRALAQGYLRRERPDHTLQPTALVHEAYLKLVDQTRVDWKGRTHFKAVAAQAMHRVLVDHARAHGREKRGGGWRRVPLYDAFQLGGRRQLDPLDLHDALEKMRQLDERQTSVVELRLFGGLSGEEAARILGVSVRTVERDWKMGQAWLRRELSRGASG